MVVSLIDCRPMEHIPVLRDEVLSFVKESVRQPELGLDVTFGRGGHTIALLEQFPSLKMWAQDRDDAAIRFGRDKYSQLVEQGRLSLSQENFHDVILDAPPSTEGWDFILADLGVSSPQLDEAERGFSFYHDGPLDMRMDRRQELTAAEIVNTWSPDDLEILFREYGEIRRPKRVVEKILEERRKNSITTTSQLAKLIEKTEGWRSRGFHPATQYFLALRLEVNAEISALRPAMEKMMQKLALGGRLLVITFHSLEDRIIKYAFKEAKEWGFPVTKKVVAPSREECKSNPRSRSAKLRVFQRGTSL